MLRRKEVRAGARAMNDWSQSNRRQLDAIALSLQEEAS